MVIWIYMRIAVPVYNDRNKERESVKNFLVVFIYATWLGLEYALCTRGIVQQQSHQSYCPIRY